MKKLLFLVAALAFVGTASAQNEDVREKKFTFGPKVGFNLSGISVTGEEESKELGVGFKPAFQVGAFAEYRAINWLAVSVDLIYSRQGRVEDITITGANISTTTKTETKLQYLNVPILVNFYITKGLALKTGIQPGFLLSAKEDVTTDGNLNTESLKDGLKTVDFAIPVGISYTFKFGLVLDARYNIGVSNIIKKEVFGERINIKMRNNVFALSAGWKF